jgi:hypothetical protein
MPHEYNDKSDTIDDLKWKDIDNLENLMKGRCRRLFDNKLAVTRFTSAIVFGTLEKIGMDMNPAMTGEDAEKVMKIKGIKIEQRVSHYKEEEDLWRRGTYIYKNNEIVTFVGGATLNKIALKWELWAASRVMKVEK